MISFVLSMLTATMSPGDARIAVFVPVSPRSWFTAPGEMTSLRWKLASGTATEPVSYRFVNYSGATVAQGDLRRVDSGEWELSLKAEPGYFEIDVLQNGQRFGLVSLPEFKDQLDPFFAIDGGLSWLEPSVPKREALIHIARRSGITMVRERLSWSAINSAQQHWNWEGGAGYDALRQFYLKRGIPVLELAHDSPAWLGRVEKYPKDLAGTSAAWSEIARHWSSSWGGLETWNEPDIDFGGNLPADQYVALAKTLSHALWQAGTKTTVVGGVMALPNRDFRELCARNGLLDEIDAFSFHNYDKALALEGIVQGYREWLRRYGHGATPLWLTECGRPWKRGPDRPPIDEDQASALDITMKGVEARSCGIARYFPFVYPFFEEKTNNFGMMDRQLTPLRSLAAYAQLIRVLADHSYLGDLSHPGGLLQRARLFGSDDDVIAVLYTGQPDPSARISLGLPAERIEGIDGRRIRPRSDGSVPIPDGLSYVWVRRSAIADRIVADTAASRMHAQSGSGKPRPAPSPIILRFQLDNARYQPSSHGYWVKDEPVGIVRLGFEVWNLGDQSASLKVELNLGEPGRPLSQPARSVAVGPRSSESIAWTVNLDAFLARANRVNAQVVARDKEGLRDQLSIMLSGEPDLAKTLAGLKNAVRLPIGDQARWTPNISPPGTMEIDTSGEAAWRLRVKQDRGRDRWAYPYFQLPSEIHLERADYLIMRARCARRAAVRLFLWEGDTDVGYITPDPVIPSDGKWHVRRVQLRDLTPSTSNIPDPNGRLDLEHVHRISLGMNFAVDDNTLEVSDLYAVSDEGHQGASK